MKQNQTNYLFCVSVKKVVKKYTITIKSVKI